MDLVSAALVAALAGPWGTAPALATPAVATAALTTPPLTGTPAGTSARTPTPSSPAPLARPGPPARPGRWAAPVATRVVRPFDAPAQPWLPGHRGVDLAAPPGTAVRAPADGRVAFVGVVAGRPVLSIDHDDPRGEGTLRTTYEPVVSTLSRGARVRQGEVVGMIDAAGPPHCPSGCLHWGARRERVYVDPLSLLGDRIRLLTPRGGRPAGSFGVSALRPSGRGWVGTPRGGGSAGA